MIGLAMLALTLGMAASMAGLLALAVRAEHLLVLRGGGGAVSFHERRPDGRYEAIPPARLPAALGRFVRGVPRPAVARARTHGRPGAR